jgi:DNA repair photolyase
MRRFTGHTEKWDEFVDIKVNAPDLLSGEIKRKPMGGVWVSGVCDSYQDSEQKAGELFELKINKKWLQASKKVIIL